MIGKPDSEVVSGTLTSIKEHNLPHKILTSKEIHEQFPVFEPSDDEIGVYEDNAGYVNPELCIETYMDIALKNGANAHYEEELLSYDIDSTTQIITCITNKQTYTCDKLILTIGAWAKPLYEKLLPFELLIQRRVLYWFEPEIQTDMFQNMPVYIWDNGIKGNFYGFPEQQGYPNAIKVAIHYCDQLLEDSMNCKTPWDIDRQVHDWEVETMRSMIKDRMPNLNGKLLQTETCMYTTTPDHHL